MKIRKFCVIDKESEVPLYKQISEEIKKKIIQMEVVEDSKLPSIRQLSTSLGVNSLTVLKAYNTLEEEGYIYKRHGSGVFVKKSEINIYYEPSEDVLDSFKGKLKDRSINFVSGIPSRDYLPFFQIEKLMKKILLEDGVEALLYHDTKGYLPLRELISKKLKDNNLDIGSEDIQIISGAQQGIDLTLKTLISQKNNKVVVGNPTYHGALNTFKKDCSIVGVTVEKDGFNLEELEEILSREKIAFIYTMTNYESPTGIAWSLEKKKKVLELCEKYKTYIVEDDCLSDIYFDRWEKPLKYYDEENKWVIYIKSFSKTIMSGLRIGYMVLPPTLTSKVLSVKFSTDISTSGLSQRVLLSFVEEGYYEDHLKKLRRIYRDYHEIAVLKLKEIGLKPEFEISGGYYLWIPLPDKIKGTDFYLRCKESYVSVLPGNIFFGSHSTKQFFRISLASATQEEIIEGIRRIGEILN